MVRTIKGFLVHSEPSHPLIRPGDKATRLESEVHQEAGLETGTYSALQAGTEVPRLS